MTAPSLPSTGHRALLVESVFEDPERMLATVRARGPYWNQARYLPVGRHAGAGLSIGHPLVPAGGGAPAVFRQDWYAHRPLVGGVRDLVHHPGLRTAALELFDGIDLDVTLVHVNLTVPGAPVDRGHVDVPAFRGLDRTNTPGWLLLGMQRSGRFEPWRVRTATAVAWLHAGDGGGFTYWLDGPGAPARRHLGVWNQAIVADADRMHHRAEPVLPRSTAAGRGRVAPSVLGADSVLVHDAAGWQIREPGAAGDVVAHLAPGDVRVSISWKAAVFVDREDVRRHREHTDDLTLPMVRRELDDALDLGGVPGNAGLRVFDDDLRVAVEEAWPRRWPTTTLPLDDGPGTTMTDPIDVDRAWGFRTRSLHAGARPDPVTGARAVPIYQTTSFVFDDAADAADLFALQKYGNVYSRIGNPTVAAFEERMANLDGGIGAVATSSGQAAELLTALALLGAGDHIVSSAELYGGTRTLFEVSLARLGIETTFVAGGRADDFAAAIRPSTRVVYTEVIANPSGAIADLAALADLAHANGVPLVVDATLATPFLCRPIEHGADIVVHSATKFIGGHGTSIGGVVVESGEFPWDNGRFPVMTEPVPSYGGLRFVENFGQYAFCSKLRAEQLRDTGATLTPFNAFQLLQGLETLPLRMAAHVANARLVAEHLDQHPDVAWVNYAGLEDSPYRHLAARYLPDGAGAVFSFGLRGGRAAGERFVESVDLLSHLANVGDARSLVIHPASTTHRQLSDEALVAGGVPPDLIRLSIGLEDPEDIVWDIDRAIAAAVAA